MEDEAIIALYWARSEEAISETDRKYGRLLAQVARNILQNRQDVEECVNDSYLGAWNAMPPQRPALLRSFLCRITRNLALDRSDYHHAAKRSVNCTASLEELDRLGDGRESVEEEVLLAQLMNDFLAGLKPEQRVIFLRRYWFFQPVKEIAQFLGWTENRVSASLSRTRRKLRDYLEQEGYTI